MASTFNVTDDTFESDILQAVVPTLVDLWAEWCEPCRMIAPVVEDLAEEYEGKLRVARMDVDSNQQIPYDYGVQSIPTLILFKEGKEVVRMVGFRNKDAILDKIEPYILDKIGKYVV